MNCLTALILTCLYQGTYVSAGIESQFQANTYEGYWCNGRWCSGPKAVFRIGTAIDVRALQLDAGLMHESFADTRRDFGTYSAYLTLTWRPFRR